MVWSQTQNTAYLEKLTRELWYLRLVDDFYRFLNGKIKGDGLHLGADIYGLDKKIARLLSSFIIVATDNETIIKAERFAKSKKWPNFSGILSSYDALPLADESYDIVIITSVLYLFDRPDSVVKEATRVLKKGGCLALIEPTVEMRPERIRLVAAKKSLTGFAFESLFNWLNLAQEHNRFSYQDIKRFYEKFNYQNIVIEEAFDRLVFFGSGLKAV
jgi:ubiquinone/menaquinone biosynthesis C-methylase UbiE